MYMYLCMCIFTDTILLLNTKPIWLHKLTVSLPEIFILTQLDAQCGARIRVAGRGREACLLRPLPLRERTGGRAQARKPEV